MALADFIKTRRPKEELKIALDVIREFKSLETVEEWMTVDFDRWKALEMLERGLAHLVEGKDPNGEETGNGT